MVFHGGITVINVRGVGTKRPAEDKILFLPLFKENLLINGEGLSDQPSSIQQKILFVAKAL